MLLVVLVHDDHPAPGFPAGIGTRSSGLSGAARATGSPRAVGIEARNRSVVVGGSECVSISRPRLRRALGEMSRRVTDYSSSSGRPRPSRTSCEPRDRILPGTGDPIKDVQDRPWIRIRFIQCRRKEGTCDRAWVGVRSFGEPPKLYRPFLVENDVDPLTGHSGIVARYDTRCAHIELGAGRRSRNSVSRARPKAPGSVAARDLPSSVGPRLKRGTSARGGTETSTTYDEPPRALCSLRSATRANRSILVRVQHT